MESIPTSNVDSQPRSIIYDRVSTLNQVKQGYSHGEKGFQLADCRKLADEIGATVVDIVEEPAASGADWDLPGLNRILEAAKRHDFDILICQDPDRLARNLAKQLVVEDELRRCGVTIRYVTIRGGDTPEDRLSRNIRGSVSEYEREKIAFRMNRGRRQKASLGYYVGTGDPPYGYRFVRKMDQHTNKNRVIGIEEDPTTGPLARRIFTEALHDAADKIAQRLTNDGIPMPRTGKVWLASTVYRMLVNPTYRGEAAWGRFDAAGKLRDPSTWTRIPVPALVDSDSWDAVQHALTERKKRRRRVLTAGNDPFVLRESLTCGHCHGAIAIQVDGAYRYYLCLRHQPHRARKQGASICCLPSIPSQAIEDHVWQRITHALLNPDTLSKGMAAARSEHDDADRRWRDRRETLAREVKDRRSDLKALVVDRARAKRDSEGWRALDQVIRETETTIERLAAEQTKLQPTNLPGLSLDQAAALQVFATEVRSGLENADSIARRKVCRLLSLRGVVSYEPDGGYQFGRHRFRVEWQAIIPVPDNNAGFSKPAVR